jgi:hypothetical protein
MGAGALAPGSVYAVFPKDKEFRAFEMLEKIEFSLKPQVVVVGAAAEPDSRIGSAEGVGVWVGGACGAAEGITLGGVLPKNRDRDLQVNTRTE